MLELLLTLALATPPEVPPEFPANFGKGDAPVVEADVVPAGEEEAAPTDVVALSEYQLAQVSTAEVASGATRVTVETNTPTPRAGSFPVRFMVDNTQGPKGTLELRVTSSMLGRQHTVRRSVELNAGERRVVNLPVSSEFRYGTASARGAGVQVQQGGSLYFQSTYAPQRVVLSLSRPEQFEAFVGKKPRYSGANVLVHAVPPAEAPGELASYLGYDAVAVPDGAALDGLEEAQRRALEQYVATGGHLLVGGQVRSTAMFPLLDGVKPGAQPYGFGTLMLTKGSPDAALPVFREAMTVSPHGALPEYQRRFNRPSVSDVLLPQATAPLGRFLLIITLFTLAIGPGSVWVARRRGPAALLVTIPGTALVTCVAIITYSAIADGFTVHASTFGYTLLDSKQHRAITHGVTAYYANLGPSKAAYGPGTVLVAPHEDGRDKYVADLTWRDGLELGGDYVPSRSYREWGLVSVEPTRARLVLTRKGEGLVAQNALGVEIDSLLVNVDGALYSGLALRDGGEKPLEAGDQRSEPQDVAAADRFATALTQRFLDQPLAPGEFLARVGGQGFVPTGGIRTELHRGEHYVRGRVEP